MTTLTIRIPESIAKRLDALAEETGRTKTYYVREAVLEYLEDLEDSYLAISRLEKPSDKRWTLEELEKELDLAH
jgi:RHH-type rel operon transcriptional repressor/antitoxin RelB